MIDWIMPIVLAGGKGTRIQSVLGDVPKVLAPVNSRFFLAYLLDLLDSVGFPKVIICIGFKGNSVRNTIGSKFGNLLVDYSPEMEPLGTGGALKQALSRFKSNFVLVMNGDSYLHFDLLSYLEWFSQQNFQASLVLSRVPDTSRYGRVTFHEEGNVVSFNEKDSAAGEGWINSGIYIFSQKVFSLFPNKNSFSLEKEFLPNLIGRGLGAYPTKGDFIDIGTPESFEKATQFFSKILTNKFLKIP